MTLRMGSNPSETRAIHTHTHTDTDTDRSTEEKRCQANKRFSRKRLADRAHARPRYTQQRTRAPLTDRQRDSGEKNPTPTPRAVRRRGDTGKRKAEGHTTERERSASDLEKWRTRTAVYRHKITAELHLHGSRGREEKRREGRGGGGGRSRYALTPSILSDFLFAIQHIVAPATEAPLHTRPCDTCVRAHVPQRKRIRGRVEEGVHGESKEEKLEST